jgi:thioredoxin-like negative regulator of GroEL
MLGDFEGLQPDTGAAVFLATGLSLRGAALLALGRDVEAAAALRDALRRNATDTNAHRLLAVVHRRAGRPDLEAAELQQHLALLPEDEESRRRLAELLRGVP